LTNEIFFVLLNMKTNIIKKEKSILTDLRLIRDKISNELTGMTAEQVVEHLKKKKTLHSKKVWQNVN
jgi:hypothetical protein